MKRRYQERLVRFRQEWEMARALSLRVGWIRVGTFLTAFALYVVADITTGSLSRYAWWGMALVSGVFLVEVFWHRRIRRREARLAGLVRVNREALARADRNWDVLSPSPLPAPPPEHPYALDLDLPGPGSLFTLLNTVNLPPGQTALREWLLAPASLEEVQRRQEAVGELGPQLDLRQEMEVLGSLVDSPDPGAVDHFLDWAESEPWLPGRPGLRMASWVLPLLNFALVALHLWALVERPWWLFSLALTFVLASLPRQKIHSRMKAAAQGQEALARYAALLEILQDMEVEAPALRDLRDAARAGPRGGPRELRILGRRIGWANVRENLLVHGPFQALFAWDLHALAGLEAWQGRSGPYVRGWLEALGRLEALAALAALRDDHPGWCFPSFNQGEEARLEARSLGHPLLPPNRCVGNDVTVGPAGTFLFVTGSNMSGKSTLLRALGLNVVLAQAGGPVCAREMTLSPMAVHTSMRTADSLAQGVSQYMAELKRIEQVVRAARRRGGTETAGQGPPASHSELGESAGESLPVLYLLDEPLQGTNEAERRVAVQTILGHLLEARALGAVATHDLYLDKAEGLRDAARAVHLEGTVEEGVDGPVLSFDYRLREGRATSTNALALLRAVGLGKDPGADPAMGDPDGRAPDQRDQDQGSLPL